MRKAFTLIEMLIVIGIIALLIGASVAAYSKVVQSAQNARARELVSNVSTALAALYQREGVWPKKLVAAASSDNVLDADAALVLGKKKYLSLSMNDDETKLIGYDRFGIVTPWATAVIKSRGTGVDQSAKVPTGGTIITHTLRFAIDDDGDGFTELPQIEGASGTKVRATACIWCCSRDGSLKSRDIIASWTQGQVVE